MPNRTAWRTALAIAAPLADPLVRRGPVRLGDTRPGGWRPRVQRSPTASRSFRA